MVRAVRSVADRMIAAVLPQTEASACYVSYCVVQNCVVIAEPGCYESCTQYCRSSSGQLCYADSYCS